MTSGIPKRVEFAITFPTTAQKCDKANYMHGQLSQIFSFGFFFLTEIYFLCHGMTVSLTPKKPRSYSGASNRNYKPNFSSLNSGVTPLGRSFSVRNHVETHFLMITDMRHQWQISQGCICFRGITWIAFRFSALSGQGSVSIIPLPFPQRSIMYYSKNT